MGKIKSLGYQIHSALNEINLQDADKRTEIFNRINGTCYDKVGKREFKKLGQNKEYIFSRRTAENTTEKSKTFINYIKENYNVKFVKDITPEMVKSFLDSRNTKSQKTITSYKNMLYKVNTAIQLKFGCKGFYDETISNYKLDKENIQSDIEKHNSLLYIYFWRFL